MKFNLNLIYLLASFGFILIALAFFSFALKSKNINHLKL